MLLPWLHDIFPFSLFMARIDEFANPLGSGSMRFLGPYWLTWDVMLGHPAALLFGYGPGSVGDIKGSSITRCSTRPGSSSLLSTV